MTAAAPEAPAKRGRGRPRSTPPALAASPPPELEKAAGRIKAKVEAIKESDIRQRYEIGKELVAILDDKTGRYGADPGAELARVMPLSKDGLRPMVNLARSYTDGEIDRLLGYRHAETGERLTWSHVIALTRVKDKDRVFELAAEAAEKGWSSKDLVRAVIGKVKKSKGGRAPKKWSALEPALADVVKKCETLGNAALKSWMGRGGLADLAGALAEQPGWRAPKDLLDLVAKAETEVDQLRMTAEGVSRQLNLIRHQLLATTKTKSVA